MRMMVNKENFSDFAVPKKYAYSNLTNNSYNPWVIDSKTKYFATDIIKQILNEINKKIKMDYYFTAFDQLVVDKVDENTNRMTADFFIHEMTNLYTRRMIAIFTVNFKTKEVVVEHLNLSNAYKLPSKDFMDLPMPELYLEDDALHHNKYHIMGINSSKIEFSLLQSDWPIKKVPTPTEFNKKILPMGIAAAYQNPQAMFPSRKQSNCWDTHGVNYIQAPTPVKMGVKNTPVTRYPYPYFNPTVNLQRNRDEEYNWLNDLVLNSSGVGANGVARSP